MHGSFDSENFIPHLNPGGKPKGFKKPSRLETYFELYSSYYIYIKYIQVDDTIMTVEIYRCSIAEYAHLLGSSIQPCLQKGSKCFPIACTP